MIEREQLQRMPRIELVDQRKLRKPEKSAGGRESESIENTSFEPRRGKTHVNRSRSSLDARSSLRCLLTREMTSRGC